MHRGNRLKQIRETLQLTQNEFARKFNLRQQYVSRYESGEGDLPIDFLNSLYKKGVDVSWLLFGNGKMFRESSIVSEPEIMYYANKTIPIVHSIPSNWNKLPSNLIIGSLSLPELDPGSIALSVENNELHWKLKKDDLVIMIRTDKGKHGDSVLLKDPYDVLSIRRIQDTETGKITSADNPEFPDMPLDHFTVIAKVLTVIRKISL
ncbi:helix-turn-helix domain-containing protein [bacterium]|nr:helix-turn-helix domain-containing protein [bacterium]